MDEILAKCDHSIEIYWAKLVCDTVHYAREFFLTFLAVFILHYFLNGSMLWIFVVISNETSKSKISQATKDMLFYFLFKGEVHLNVIPSW